MAPVERNDDARAESLGQGDHAGVGAPQREAA
jgi:hypothetical protein